MGNPRVQFWPRQTFQEVGAVKGLRYGQTWHPGPEFYHAPIILRAFLCTWARFDSNGVLREADFPYVNPSSIAWDNYARQPMQMKLFQ